MFCVLGGDEDGIRGAERGGDLNQAHVYKKSGCAKLEERGRRNGMSESIDVKTPPLAPDVVVRGKATGFAQEVEVGPHRLAADEPLGYGGTEQGVSPYDLLLAALGTCTSMTIGLYARRRNWPLEDITVSLRHSKIYAVDCEECETKEGRIDRIERDIHLTGDLSTEQRAKLMEIADKCPVHQTLDSEINIRTKEV